MMLPQQQAALFFLAAVAGCRPSAPPPQPMVTTISPTVVLETVSDISMILLGHPAATALSPDGSRFVSLVSTAKGDEMVIWDTQSGSIVSQWELPLHNRISPMKRDLLCCADARIICCRGSEIVVWDAQSQQETLRLEEGLVALSWDGQRIATLNKQARGDVGLFDSLTGMKTDTITVLSEKDLQTNRDDISSLWLAPGGNSLLVQRGSRGPLEVWDLQNKSRVARLWGNPTSQIVFSADGERMASLGEQTIRIWDVKNWSETHSLDRSEYALTAFAFSRDGQSLWHHGQANEVVQWDLKSGTPVGAVQLVGNKDVDKAKQYRFNQRIAFSSNGRAISIYQTSGPEGYPVWGAMFELDEQAARQTPNSILTAMTVSKPENLLATISFPRVSSMSAQGGIRRPEFIVNSPNSNQVAVFNDLDVLLLDPTDPANRHSLDYPQTAFELGLSPAWSPTGDLLGTLGTGRGYARTVVQWNVVSGERTILSPKLTSQNNQDVLTCLDYSPDGLRLAVGNGAGQVIVFDTNSGDVVQVLAGKDYYPPLEQVAFVDEGKSIIGFGYGSQVLRWDMAETDQPITPRALFKPPGSRFILSANNQVGASVTNRGTEVVIQELDTQKVIGSWKPPVTSLEGIQLSPNGTFIAAWAGPTVDTEQGKVHIYNVRQQKPGVVLQHPKPRYRSRRAEIQAVTFTNDDQTIVTSDTLAIRIWKNAAARRKSGEQ